MTINWFRMLAVLSVLGSNKNLKLDLLYFVLKYKFQLCIIQTNNITYMKHNANSYLITKQNHALGIKQINNIISNDGHSQ